MLVALLLAGLTPPVVGYDGVVEPEQTTWTVSAPWQQTARFVRPLPAGAVVEGAEAELADDGRIVAVRGVPRLDFTVRVPRADDLVQPPFFTGPALHRVVVRGPALDFSGTGLRASIRYRASLGITSADRDHIDGALGGTTFGAMPIYVQEPTLLGEPLAVARVSPDGGRGAVWFVVGAFGAVLMLLVVLYRRLGHRARWEKTKVRVDNIVRDPLT